MSLLDNLKEIATDAIGSTVSSQIETMANSYIKEQINSGNTAPINQMIQAVLGNQDSIGNALDHLVQKFNVVDLGKLIQSWIGNGTNLPFNISQVKTVFGENWIEQLANKIGINPMIVTGLIAYFLPSFVDEVAKNDTMKNTSTQNFDAVKLLTSLVK